MSERSLLIRILGAILAFTGLAGMLLPCIPGVSFRTNILNR